MHILRNPPTATVLLLLAGASAVQAHMIMANPVPYGYQTIDNSPLTGANYPCKVTSDPATFYSTDGIDNTYPAGSSQSLSFKGSAVHGGGSCQLAITNDMQPSASTDWRVILSIESGCPTTDGTGPSTYNWTVPAELAPGQYSFAWTWISKLAGQPEYYMNCAPITVTPAADAGAGAAVARRDLASYPELFVANLDAINSCKTEPSTDPVYPDPGPDVEKLLAGGTANFATVTQSGCVPLSQTQGNAALPAATAGAGAGAGASAGGANTTAVPGTSSATSSSSPSSSSSPEAPSASIPGGSFATATQAPSAATTFATSTVADSASPPASSSPSQTLVVIPVTPTPPGSAAASTSPTPAPSSDPAPSGSDPATTASSSSSPAPSTSSASASSSAAPAPTGGAGSSNGTGPAAGGAAKSGTCAQEGMFNCVGARYQQCASGRWTSMQALPGGTSCTQGESAGLWARAAGAARVGGLFRRVPRGRMAAL